MKADTEPMESDFWQSKTEPLDSEYWEPFWAARIIFVGGVVVLAIGIICAIVALHNWPNEWRKVVPGCFGAGLFLLALLRYKKKMRLLRDARIVTKEDKA